MRLPAHKLSAAAPPMGVTRKAIVSAWFIVFGLFALSGSGMRIVGSTDEDDLVRMNSDKG